MIRLVLCLSACLLATPIAATPVQPQFAAFDTVYLGFEPGIRLSGLTPRAAVQVHAVRTFEGWTEGADKQWRPQKSQFRSWVLVTADARGQIDLGRTAPVQGTYAGVDGYGLLWSMRKLTDPALAMAPLPDGAWGSLEDKGTLILAVQGGKVLASAQLDYRDPPGLTVRGVGQGRLHGVFAAPSGAGRRPVVILLHGSEGGSAEGARELAVRYAGQGYAAFALNYFAWDFKGLKGPPNHHVNQPIELIADVRDWLAKQPEADVERLGIYGHSKGAEYAVVAASHYPWIDAVVACVPSDVVWEGYGIGDPRNQPDPALTWPEQRSSWSWQGQPLAYVPLRVWEDKAHGPWFDNTERYDVSRSDNPEAAKAAAIPIERSPARFLLLGGGRDEVWASGRMASALKARMKSAGKGRQVDLVVYPAAGHMICGDGTYPTHIWSDASRDPRRKDLVAEGAAAADGWRRTLRFFKQRL